MACAVAWPNAPAAACGVQKFPSAPVRVCVSVLSGVRFTGIAPTNVPSFGGQSIEVPPALVVTQGCPLFCPESQTPPAQVGQVEGWPSVKKTRGERLMLTLETPVERSTVPLASLANVLTTQLGGKPLIGIGGPKKQLASGA